MAAERSVNVRVRLKGANQFKKDMQDVNGSLSTMGGWLDTAKGILASDLISSGLNAIANAFKSCVDQSIDFETAMAGVQKTTGMSDSKLAAMSNELMDLSERIPVTAEELAGLAETAGQLGIAQDDITEFVEVVAAMGVSTNMSAEDAATAMARMANIMGTGAQDYERMGSTIVELGNNMATTESEIIDMAQSMAGVGNLVGMSEADVLGFAAAMSSVGIEAEAGASSMSTLWTELETMVATGSADLAGFAEVAGMTSEAFISMWDADPASAFSEFISGLQQVGVEGGSVMGVLAELGITEIRQRRAVASLAGASDILAEALGLSGAAWEENSALAEEAGAFYGTSASRIQMAENAVANLQKVLGEPIKDTMVLNAESIGEWASKAREELQEMENLPERYAEIDAELEVDLKGYDSAERQANTLIDTLENLGDASELSAGEQLQYQSALEMLAQIVPGVAGMIDVETLAIEGGTDALREAVTQTVALSKSSRELEAAKEKYDAYTLAAEQAAEKMNLLAIAQMEYDEAAKEHEAIVQRQNELQKEAEAEADRILAETGQMTSATALLESNEEWATLDGQLRDATNTMTEASNRVSELQAEVDEETQYLEENAHVVGEYETQLAESNAEMGVAVENMDELTDAEKEAIGEFTLMSMQLESLEAELTAAMETARSQLDSVVHGFDAIEMPEAVSADELLENLQSQIDYMAQYQENLAAVQEMGLDADIVAMLSDGSTESAAILAGLVEDGGESIDELNAKFAEVNTGKEAMAMAMAEAAIDFTNRANEIVTATDNMVAEANQYGSAYNSGAKTIQGLIDGMNSRISTYEGRVNYVRSLSASAAGSGGSDGTSHAAGLTYVPYDGYLAQLHRGEMVLTALEARAYRAQQFADYGALAALEARGGIVNNDYRRAYDGRIDNSVRVGDIYVRNETDISRLERQLTGRSRSVARGYGAMGR